MCIFLPIFLVFVATNLDELSAVLGFLAGTGGGGPLGGDAGPLLGDSCVSLSDVLISGFTGVEGSKGLSDGMGLSGWSFGGGCSGRGGGALITPRCRLSAFKAFLNISCALIYKTGRLIANR